MRPKTNRLLDVALLTLFVPGMVLLTGALITLDLVTVLRDLRALERRGVSL